MSELSNEELLRHAKNIYKVKLNRYKDAQHPTVLEQGEKVKELENKQMSDKDKKGEALNKSDKKTLMEEVKKALKRRNKKSRDDDDDDDDEEKALMPAARVHGSY